LIQASPSTSETQKQQAYTFWCGVLFAAVLAGFCIYAVGASTLDLLWAFVPALLVTVASIWFTNREKDIRGNTVLLAAVGLLAILLPFVRTGMQPALAISTLALIGTTGLFTFPLKNIGMVIIAGAIPASVSLFVDLFSPTGRESFGSPTLHWVITLILMAIWFFALSREFLALNIRTKIVIGILGTGGLTLGIFAILVATQTQQITNTLSGRLESSVSSLAEEQLINTVNSRAEQANQSFSSIRVEVEGLARNWIALQQRRASINQGTYWDAQLKLIQLEGGQYGNPATDTSSIYVPAKLALNDSLYKDMNTSAYLDFYAPGVLEANPSLLAVYAIDPNGITRYYPNIELASLLPPDFDATKRPYYQITSPLFNPQRATRWTIPYVDATGGGLVVTVAAPVYIGDRFSGVIAADMQLTEITRQVQSLQIGETGYGFMLDDAARIIAMPSAGYKLFGLNPDAMKTDEFFKETILGAGSDELQAIVRRMAAGGNGLLIVNVDGVDTYVSYAPVRANGYSLALVVPVSELQGAITTARSQTQSQIQSAVRVLAIILVSMLFLSILISLAIGQVISSPIVQLTGAANRIVGGELGAQAAVSSKDEIGALAQAFNTMTARLRESLQDLENRVEERTAELASANEKNERRAQQFESISQVASTISSTRDLNSLLPQIATAISTKFGFYHTGIFLLDSRKEFAVLSAANSEGGQRMLARNHRLRVGETGLVGFVTSTGRARVALDTGQDAVFFNNPDLPNTHSEIALPLKIGDEVIGALDVQSTAENAFGHEDISILTTLADQVSIAIQNARQSEETRKALAESVASGREFIQTGWQQFTRNQKLTGIRHTGARATLLYSDGNGNSDENLLSRESTRLRNRVSLSLPVKLRGEIIGTLDVQSVDNRKWDQDELDIVAAIIERAAIALESARLLAESQKRAAKERTIGEISSKISAQTDIDKLLKIAAQELNRTLPGAEIAIQFNSSEEME